MFKENRKANEQVTELLKQRLLHAVEAGVNDAVTHVAVDTRRLQRSIRKTDVEIERDYMECSILAGGGEVDYAYEQELREPYLRPAMMAIDEAMRSE